MSELREHEANLAEYRTQLEQVRDVNLQTSALRASPDEPWLAQVESLLLAEPDNEEYAGIHESLTEAGPFSV